MTIISQDEVTFTEIEEKVWSPWFKELIRASGTRIKVRPVTQPLSPNPLSDSKQRSNRVITFYEDKETLLTFLRHNSGWLDIEDCFEVLYGKKRYWSWSNPDQQKLLKVLITLEKEGRIEIEYMIFPRGKVERPSKVKFIDDLSQLS